MTQKLILIKEGDYRQNLFSDFVEYVNNDYAPPSSEFQSYRERSTEISEDHTYFGFYNRMDFSMRLAENYLGNIDNRKLALIHYRNDPLNLSTEPDVFKVIDFNDICNTVDRYGNAVFGLPVYQNEVPDYTVIKNATILARDSDKNVILDVYKNNEMTPGEDRTGQVEYLHKGVPVISYFGVIKIKDLPIYYVILDPRITKISTGLYIENDFMNVRVISDHEGGIKNVLMTPMFSGNTEIIANYFVYTTEDEIEISLFEQNDNLIKLYNVDVSDIKIQTKSNFPVEVLPGGKLKVKLTGPDGFIKFKIDGGDFFEVASHKDDLEFAYIFKKY